MASCILQPAYGHTSFSIPHFCRTTSQKVPHKAEHPRPWDTAAGRGMCVWWWIETSDGHNRGRTLNWLTDPSLRQRKGWPNRRGRLSISPPPAGSETHWWFTPFKWPPVSEERRNEEAGLREYRGVPHFRGGWMDDRVKMATPADLFSYWVATLTRGCVIISIRPFRAVLYAVTISLASNVWNEICCQVFMPAFTSYSAMYSQEWVTYDVHFLKYSKSHFYFLNLVDQPLQGLHKTTQNHNRFL